MTVLATIDIDTVGSAIVWAAGVIGGIGVLFRFLGTYILAPYARAQANRVSDQLDDKLSPVLNEVRTIRAEVTYNGGGSLKDAVRRTERRIDRLEGRFDEHDRFTRGETEEAGS